MSQDIFSRRAPKLIASWPDFSFPDEAYRVAPGADRDSRWNSCNSSISASACLSR